MAGAFQTSRDIFINPIWQDIPKFRIFFYIVGNAVFSNEGVVVGGIHIKRGQYLRSYRNLSDDLQFVENRKIKKYSVSVISRKIEQLVKEERLKIEDSELGTLFTVVNYDEYQRLDNYKSKLGTEMEQCWNNDGTEMEQRWNNNKNVKKDKKDKKDKNNSSCHKYEICDMENSEMLYQEILKNNPNFKKPNLEKWANDFRLMRERDKRTDDQVKFLIQWVQADSFWKSNILSPAKLRKQFDALVIKVKTEREKKKGAASMTRKEDFNLDD